MTPLLSVVVPTYNRGPLLNRTLGALARQSLPPSMYEVIVVDDGSTDDTPEMVRGWSQQTESIRLLRRPTNRGRSAARNDGIREARGEIVVFVDSDVVVRPDFLAQHLETHRQAGAPVLCRGPVVTVSDGHLPERLPLTSFSPAYLDTANASLPRAELIAVGLFDEGFRVYGWEDFDLGLRLQQRGLRRVFRTEAVAYHIQPTPSEETFEENLLKEEERARTAIYFHSKHPGWKTRFLIQQTPLHAAAYFLLTAGGLINRDNAPALGARLRRIKLLEYLVHRGVLNRHYLETLRRQWPHGANGSGQAPSP